MQRVWTYIIWWLIVISNRSLAYWVSITTKNCVKDLYQYSSFRFFGILKMSFASSDNGILEELQAFGMLPFGSRWLLSLTFFFFDPYRTSSQSLVLQYPSDSVNLLPWPRKARTAASWRWSLRLWKKLRKANAQPAKRREERGETLQKSPRQQGQKTVPALVQTLVAAMMTWVSSAPLLK